MVWVYSRAATKRRRPIDEQLPEELVGNPFVMGGRIEPRARQLAVRGENGFDEGHAKYLHRTALWRLFKTMPTWNITRMVRGGRGPVDLPGPGRGYWEADFPGLGRWSNQRWWKSRPPQETFNIGNTG